MQAILSPATAEATDGRPASEVDLEAPILVVDDSAVSRTLAAGLIRSGTGRPVLFAENGREAMEILACVTPAAVVTDLQMPEMDGLALVVAIREQHPGMPVILMTAYGSETIAHRALKAGAAHYVPKACLTTELVDTIGQVLCLGKGHVARRRLIDRQTARFVRYELENDPDLIGPLIELLLEELAGMGIGDGTARMRVGVALQEALANALFHGNLECSSDLRQEDERIFYRLAEQRRAIEPFRSRRIFIESEVDREHARIVIRDEGPGFDVTKLDKPFDPEDLMRVGGRGMLLIRTFMDEVAHNARGNQIRLIKRA